MAEPTSSKVLNDQHLAKLNDSLAQLSSAEQELALAHRAGLNSPVPGQSIADYQAKIAELKSKLLAVKNVYFPNSQ